jgi:hypothetical protein
MKDGCPGRVSSELGSPESAPSLRSAARPKRVGTRNLRLHGTCIWGIVCTSLIRAMFANPILGIDPNMVPMASRAFMEKWPAVQVLSRSRISLPEPTHPIPAPDPDPSSQGWGLVNG